MPASRNFKGHLVTEILNTYDINSDRLAIVESVTCHVQDLDMVVSKPFKGRLCYVYGELLLSGTALPTKKTYGNHLNSCWGSGLKLIVILTEDIPLC